MSPALNPKQMRFVNEYLVHGCGTRAAISAGYPVAGAAVAANRLLKNAKARALIERRQGVDSRRLQIGRQEAIQGLLEAVAMAKSPTNPNPAALISAWKAIAQLLGLYPTERRQIEVTAGSSLADMGPWEAMSDAELVAVIAGAG